MEWREQGLTDRIGEGSLAGRPAEEGFIRWMASRGRIEGRHFIRTGFDQVDTTAGLVASMDPIQQHTPDFIQVGGHAWEIQGSSGWTWIFKKPKVDCLTRYESMLSEGRQVRWFLWNSTEQRAIIMSHGCLLATIADGAELVEEIVPRNAGWYLGRNEFSSRMVEGDPFEAERTQRKLQAGLL